VTLHAILARSAIERTELRQLEVGDIISTEQLASQPADVECRGVTGDMEILFRGQTGLYKDSKALRLLGS
jgi:flagellar motor switch protein FliM